MKNKDEQKTEIRKSREEVREAWEGLKANVSEAFFPPRLFTLKKKYENFPIYFLNPKLSGNYEFQIKLLQRIYGLRLILVYCPKPFETSIDISVLDGRSFKNFYTHVNLLPALRDLRLIRLLRKVQLSGDSVDDFLDDYQLMNSNDATGEKKASSESMNV